MHFKTNDKYFEPSVLSILLTGQRSPLHWGNKEVEKDFYDLKGILENLLKELRIKNFSFEPSQYKNFHPGRQARILIDQHEVGVMGEVHPATLQRMDISHRVLFSEINIEDLLHTQKNALKLSPLPQFPASIRDWTLTLKETCPIAEVFQLIQKQKSKFLEDVSLVDIYHSEKLGAEWKNATLRFVYRDYEQTISFKTIEIEHQRMIKEIIEKLQKENKVQT